MSPKLLEEGGFEVAAPGLSATRKSRSPKFLDIEDFALCTWSLTLNFLEFPAGVSQGTHLSQFVQFDVGFQLPKSDI